MAKLPSKVPESHDVVRHVNHLIFISIAKIINILNIFIVFVDCSNKHPARGGSSFATELSSEWVSGYPLTRPEVWGSVAVHSDGLQTDHRDHNYYGCAKSAVWLTKKVRLGLPSECQKWAVGPSLWWQTVPCPRCSHRKGTVAKGSPTSWRHMQCWAVQQY